MHRKSLLLLVILIWVALAPDASGQEPIRARTDTGKEVILHPNGTWKYSVESEPKQAGTRLTKSTTAKKAFKPKRGDFTVWYDDDKWKMDPEKPGEEPFFQLMGEDAYAIIISEGLEVPLETLKKVVLENARSEATDVNLLMEEKRMVNGVEVLCLKMSLTKDQVPFTFYGYYFGGKQGAIQVVTYTGRNLFDKYQQVMTEFLNGLQIQ